MSSTAAKFYSFAFNSADGAKQIKMSDYAGKVVLLVNVASKCGYTPKNYPDLVDLSRKYYQDGLRIILSPCNQFGGQEPGSATDVCQFVASTYSAEPDAFTVTEKVDVNGSSAHPLWKWIQNELHGLLTNAIKWNFTKFLIDRDGQPIARYAPGDKPSSFEPKIKELLAKSAKQQQQ